MLQSFFIRTILQNVSLSGIIIQKKRGNKFVHLSGDELYVLSKKHIFVLHFVNIFNKKTNT